MKKENNALNSKIVELLTQKNSTRSDIAQLLIGSGYDISDEDMENIELADHPDDETFDEVPYELSEDGKSFAVDVDNKMPKEVKKSFVRIPTKEEARFLQDIYYQTQKRRIAIAGQIRAIAQSADSTSEDQTKNDDNMLFMEWFLEQMQAMEDNIKRALEAFSDSYYISKWAKQNIGIGPVIATALAANLEIKDETMHAGNWWSYCGLNDNKRPWLGKVKSKEIVDKCIADNGGILDDMAVYKIADETKWKFSWLESKAKKKKGWSKEELIKACSFIPYNKSMKVLMYKIGHSFRLCKNKPDSLYGRLLKEREDFENTNNVAGVYADQAADILKSKNFDKKTIAYSYYSNGQLPPAHIAQRAERYATKLFISHLFEAAYYNKYGKQCPEPYTISHQGHVDYIGPEVTYDSVDRDNS